uniref:Uncharacterized protein n=1 Tax=Cucumis melo TaxID=3656 RepID=A0A9I9CYE8_CUCME
MTQYPDANFHTLDEPGRATLSKRRDIDVEKNIRNNKLSRRMHAASRTDYQKLDNINFLRHIFLTHVAWRREQRRE